MLLYKISLVMNIPARDAVAADGREQNVRRSLQQKNQATHMHRQENIRERQSSDVPKARLHSQMHAK